MENNNDKSFKYTPHIMATLSASSIIGLLIAMRRTPSATPKNTYLSKIVNDPYIAQQNPKLAAYMFAGNAFLKATAFTLSSTVLLTSLTMISMNASTLKEFSINAKAFSRRLFPALVAKDEMRSDNEEIALFMKEWEEGKGDDRDVMDTEGHRIIKKQMITGLGSLAFTKK